MYISNMQPSVLLLWRALSCTELIALCYNYTTAARPLKCERRAERSQQLYCVPLFTIG